MFFATLITIPVAALAHFASGKGTVVAIITFSIFLGVGTYYAKTFRSYLWQMLIARFTEPR
jgi:Na+/H+-dicarboxylate symporter